jgi:hypothetical protein
MGGKRLSKAGCGWSGEADCFKPQVSVARSRLLTIIRRDVLCWICSNFRDVLCWISICGS